MSLRIMGPWYPVIMSFVVIATANHWVLDCMVGAVLVYVGWRVNWVLLVLRPFEEWLFWLFRTEKPRDVVSKGDDEN